MHRIDHVANKCVASADLVSVCLHYLLKRHSRRRPWTASHRSERRLFRPGDTPPTWMWTKPHRSPGLHLLPAWSERPLKSSRTGQLLAGVCPTLLSTRRQPLSLPHCQPPGGAHRRRRSRSRRRSARVTLGMALLPIGWEALVSLGGAGVMERPRKSSCFMLDGVPCTVMEEYMAREQSRRRVGCCMRGDDRGACSGAPAADRGRLRFAACHRDRAQPTQRCHLRAPWTRRRARTATIALPRRKRSPPSAAHRSGPRPSRSSRL